MAPSSRMEGVVACDTPLRWTWGLAKPWGEERGRDEAAVTCIWTWRRIGEWPPRCICVKHERSVVSIIYNTHRPGGVVIFGSHVVHSPLQYAWLCATWNGSSLGGGEVRYHLVLERSCLWVCLPCTVPRRCCSPPSEPKPSWRRRECKTLA